MKISFPFLSLALAPIAFTVQGQVPYTCSTSGLEHLQPFLQDHPERLQEIQQNTTALEQFTQHFSGDGERGNQKVIPVVFHIIHNNGNENISDEQVKDAVRILNNDYNKLNSDWDLVRPEFLGIVADIGITFRLAGLDPDGNCTTGITRTVSPLTNDGTQTMKDLIDWPRDQYLNIWVAASADGAAGYSMYPGAVASQWAAPSDGIVILSSYVGSIGTSSLTHSRSLTHEVGHWINLKHCWGDSNTPAVADNCNMDDGVSDTPNTIGWQSCNLSGASCGSPLDNVENYMEYSYCSKMFTIGQRTRMLAALNSNTASRNNLWTTSNLVATGTADIQPLCAAEFTAENSIICAGDSVHFSDASYHDASTWSWEFSGGSANSTQVAAPVVAYDTPGVYPVSLTAGNGLSTVSITHAAYVTVLSNIGSAFPYSEDFEAMNAIPNDHWVVSDPDANGSWALRTNAGYSGTHSVRMKNNGTSPGYVDELFGPTIDLSQAASVTMSFRYAFARTASTDDDVLRIYVSNDCGAHWSLRKQLKGSTNLSTVPDQTANFTPSSAAQWGYAEITNISSAYHVADFRYKFWFQGNGGNDLWLDDINIHNTDVGISEFNAPGMLDAIVLPNPAIGDAQVAVQLPQSGPTRIELLDPLGRVVAVVNEGNVGAGYHRWSLPLEHLLTGLYFVRIQQGEAVRVVRFTKS